MASPGNAAEKIDLTDDSAVAEPSMDEILASIREIIAEDENFDDGLTERERYSHPENPSNSNEVVDADGEKADLSTALNAEPAEDVDETEAMLAEMEAGLEQQISSAVNESNVSEKVAAEVAALEAGSMRAEALIEQNGAEKAVASDAPQPTSANLGGVADTKSSNDLHARAEEVRKELGLSTAAAGGQSLEQRLEHYRVRGKASAAAAAAEKAEQTEILKEAVQAAIVTAPASAVAPASANDVAEALLNKQSGALTGQMEEFMRPLIRQWLNDNLPGVVERLVRSEIERVSQGRRAAGN